MTSLNLTQKENMLLQDQQKHEQLCVQKYQDYAQQAQDPQLQQLFNSLSQKEQQHLDTINQLLNGQIPNLQQNQQQGQQPGQQQNAQTSQQFALSGGTVNPHDITLCNDMLITEKYISNSYDNAIFENTNSQVRQILNHIQKEEQQHGEAIYNYIQSKGMYNP
ncbi:spore coat protein [Peptococcaceae bacterium 1198_IL3148]